MVKVIFNMPVEVIAEDGTVIQDELTKTIELPESPRTDIIYQDDELDAIISSNETNEVLVTDVIFDMSSKTYIATCERARISLASYTESKHRTTWRLYSEPAKKSTWSMSE